MSIERIDDLDDPRVALYRNVTDGELLRREGVFMAESRRVVRTLLRASPHATRSVLVIDQALEALADVLEPASETIPVYVVDRKTCEGVLGVHIHQGCLAVGERPPERGIDVFLEDGDEDGDGNGDAVHLVVLERVSAADNVGAIFRSALAFGMAGAILDARCADPLYRKAIKTSVGTALQLPFAIATDWPADLDRLRDAGFRVACLSPDGESTLGDLARERSGDRVALVLGSEGDGLSEEAKTKADLVVRIPIAAEVDSLNVAVAGGIAMSALSAIR